MPESSVEESERFRDQVRAWLEANLPPTLRAHPHRVSEAMVDGAEIPDDVRTWRACFGATGWGVP
ncbi:hypothetical protein ABTI01_19810, partial [Acinetobacter baumannii]